MSKPHRMPGTTSEGETKRKERGRARALARVQARTAKTADRPKRERSEKEIALDAAVAEKTRRLAELRREYEPKIADLEVEYAEKRREVWRDYEQRKELIRTATLLKA